MYQLWGSTWEAASRQLQHVWSAWSAGRAVLANDRYRCSEAVLVEVRGEGSSSA